MGQPVVLTGRARRCGGALPLIQRREVGKRHIESRPDIHQHWPIRPASRIIVICQWRTTEVLPAIATCTYKCFEAGISMDFWEEEASKINFRP